MVRMNRPAAQETRECRSSMQAGRIGGTWSNQYESFFKCGGHNVADWICVTGLDAKLTR